MNKAVNLDDLLDFGVRWPSRPRGWPEQLPEGAILLESVLPAELPRTILARVRVPAVSSLRRLRQYRRAVPTEPAMFVLPCGGGEPRRTKLDSAVLPPSVCAAVGGTLGGQFFVEAYVGLDGRVGHVPEYRRRLAPEEAASRATGVDAILPGAYGFWVR